MYQPVICSNHIETQFIALRYFALDGADHVLTRGGQHDPPVQHLAQLPQRTVRRTTDQRKT
jgi:hypothetical protein